MAGGGGLADEDARRAEGEPRHDRDQRRHEREQDPGHCQGQRGQHRMALAAAVDEPPADRRHHHAEQVDEEERSQRRRSQPERGRSQVEGHVGERRHQGQQDVEARSEGCQELKVSQVSGHLANRGRKVCGWDDFARGRQGRQNQRPAGQVDQAENDKRIVPPEPPGNPAGHEPADDTAQHVAADIGAHRGPGSARRPFLGHVGHGHGDDAGHDQALREAPADERVQPYRRRRQQRGDRQGENSGHNDDLPSDALGQQTDRRSTIATATVVAVTVRLACSAEAWKTLASIGSSACVE